MVKTTRRILSIWFPRLPSERALRLRPRAGAFVLSHMSQNSMRIYCLTPQAEAAGIYRGMPLADARAFCPDLHSAPAQPQQDERFLTSLCRWAERYSPWVGLEGADGLVLDVTGVAHLWGDEQALLSDLRQRLMRAGLSVQLALGPTRGAAWALARFGEGLIVGQDPSAALRLLPIAALRLEERTQIALARVGLRHIKDIMALPRATLSRRFGPTLLQRLDQALGHQAEPITPHRTTPHYGVRLSLPEPIGLLPDVMEATQRLLIQLCHKLAQNAAGTRHLCLTIRRVDQASQDVELRLARPLRDPDRILPLFERGLKEVDAGYGIDQLRLVAHQVTPLRATQISNAPESAQKNKREAIQESNRLDDLMSQLGTRVGLENIYRFLPAESHIPERSYLIAPAAYSTAQSGWASLRPRPLCLFAPEPIRHTRPQPPKRFYWRRMALRTAQAIGPERIAPEWWLDDPAWRNGLRDYWQIHTHEGRRLWLFYTPQSPDWFVHGEFA